MQREWKRRETLQREWRWREGTQREWHRGEILQREWYVTGGLVTERDAAKVSKLFCGMHLGVNLRDAQVKALSGSPPSVDSIVHSACKLLGHLEANPEYGGGGQAFPEYIKALLEEAEAVGDTDSEDAEALKAALGVRVERLVGSRYFVTARNAGRMFYLRSLAVRYLEATELRKELNGLERDVLANLRSRHGAALLKVDGLFFDAIYADLMCLLKSKKLAKKFLDMNPHYLELRNGILSNSPFLFVPLPLCGPDIGKSLQISCVLKRGQQHDIKS